MDLHKCLTPFKFKRSVLEKTKGLCHLCDCPVEFKQMTYDHITPKSFGGKYSFDNLLPAHKRCNSVRGNRSISTQEQYEKVKEYVKKHLKFTNQ